MALRYLGLCVLTLAFLVPAQLGVAQPAPVAPISAQPVRDHIVLNGKRLPLPPGEWTRLSQGFGRVQGAWPGAYGTIEAVLLAEIKDLRIESLVLLQTNALPVEGGWGIPEACASAPFTWDVRPEGAAPEFRYVTLANGSVPPGLHRGVHSPPPARRCVCLWIGTPRRAGPPYGLPAQASSGIGGFRTPNVRPPRVKGDVLTLQNQGTFQLCVGNSQAPPG